MEKRRKKEENKAPEVRSVDPHGSVVQVVHSVVTMYYWIALFNSGELSDADPVGAQMMGCLFLGS